MPAPSTPFADKPDVLTVILLLAAGLPLFAILATIRHEKHSYSSPMPKK